ncbi:hypothetical protein AJ88_35245 [Mesorhizobium amorphae CCBAU 01583]|nr:hypothetical protein AJ88_35245 [Mesorhizobium amorphae CCBAU 01583]
MSLQDVSQDADPRDRFAYLVNSVPNRSRDRQIEGREILEKSGYLPADQHILIQVLDRGTQSIGLNEKVDLREEGIEQFRAFAGDRIYAFTVDLRGYSGAPPRSRKPSCGAMPVSVKIRSSRSIARIHRTS